jgi:ABC-type antimicrobial peptide transport system permease subunit
VGVVADVKQLSLALSDAEAVYVPAAQWHVADPAMSLVVRAARDPAGLGTAVRQAIWSVDRDQAIVRTAAMTDLLAATAAERRFSLVLFQLFAFSALLLAAAGIYGVVSGGVAERTREIGVRSALGATRRDLVLMVVRQGLCLTGVGVGLGLAVALITTRVLAAWLFGVSPLDPVAHLSVVALLATTALAASALPAWRAARVDAARTLQAE